MTVKQLVDRHYREVNTDDYSDADDIFSADVVTEPPGSGPLRGIEPFVAYGRAFHRAFPDGRIHGDRYVESGDVVVVEGRFTGTHTGPLDTPTGQIPATGRPMVLPFADLFRVVDGKIAEHRIYFDTVGMLAQLGLMPGSAPA
jgi:ketosteroid isomerase-like protein